MTPSAAPFVVRGSPLSRGLFGLLSVVAFSGVPTGVSVAADTDVPSSGPPPIRAEGPAVVKARTAALLMSEMAGGEVRASVLALPATGPSADPGTEPHAAAESVRAVWVKVEIDAGGVLGGGESEGGPRVETGAAIPMEVFLYALSPDGEILDVFTVRFDLSSAVRRELLAGRGLAVATTLDLPPGLVRLRHLVWSETPEREQRFGLGTTSVTVPSGDPRSVLWIPERSDRWIRVKPRERHIEGWTGGESVPATLPVLEAPYTTAKQVASWWRARGSEPGHGRPSETSPQGSTEGVIRLRPDGPAHPEDRTETAAFFEVPFEVLEGRTAVGGGELVRVAFAVPEVEPGRYRLILQPRDGDAPLPLPVVVAGAEDGEIWPRVLPAVLDSTEEPFPEDEAPSTVPESPAAGKRTVAEDGTGDGTAHRRQYREVIARLAGGDPEGAAADLARLEAEALEGREDGDMGAVLTRLGEVQRATAAELLGPQGEGAPALALLHAEAARRHFRATRWSLADRTVEQVVWLAEGHAMVRESREARRDAAGLLAWLAADLRQAGRGSQARDMFQRSLDLEETDAALLGLATLEERSGGISKAVEALERLVERDPAHREARLRLAVNLVRLGRLEPARDLLRRLMRTEDTSWVTAVAFQELARVDLDQRDCTGAVRVLRRALDRFPEEPQLAVQLAWALECAGETGASRETAARIVERARRGETGGDCPRTRYTRWSPAVLAPERERLGELARESRQALAVRLGAMGAGP